MHSESTSLQRLAGFVRLVLRGGGILALSLLFWLYASGVRVVTSRSPEARYRHLCRAMSVFCRAAARVIGMRIQILGTPPKAPFVLVANHISFTDILLLCATSPAWFVSNSKVARWPLFGPLVRMTNTLFIDREVRREVQRMNARILGLVGQGEGVIFFPEGGTSDGRSVLPFKPSLLQAAIDLGIPVHCAAIHYRTPPGAPPADQLIPWSAAIHFGSHLKKLLSAPGFTARIHFEAEAVQAEDRKKLAIASHRLIAERLAELSAAPP